jgi:hypothetical protein
VDTASIISASGGRRGDVRSGRPGAGGRALRAARRRRAGHRRGAAAGPARAGPRAGPEPGGAGRLVAGRGLRGVARGARHRPPPPVLDRTGRGVRLLGGRAGGVDLAGGHRARTVPVRRRPVLPGLRPAGLPGPAAGPDRRRARPAAAAGAGRDGRRPGPGAAQLAHRAGRDPAGRRPRPGPRLGARGGLPGDGRGGDSAHRAHRGPDAAGHPAHPAGAAGRRPHRVQRLRQRLRLPQRGRRLPAGSGRRRGVGGRVRLPGHGRPARLRRHPPAGTATHCCRPAGCCPTCR